MSNFKTGYLQVMTPSGIGTVCVCVDVQPKGVEGQYRAAFSFCNPTDKFNKQKARSMAVARLYNWRSLKNKNGDVIDVNGPNRITWIGKHTNISSIFLVALDNAIKCDKAPYWVTKAIKKGPVTVGLKLSAQNFDVSFFS